MKVIPTLLILAFILTGRDRINAQTQNNCSCCDAIHQQFDFWIGEWSVLDSLGSKLGKNNISAIEGHCIISEHWQGSSGGTGSSYSYYDPSDSTWNQLWVNNRGNILRLKGVFLKNKMTLKSDLITGKGIDAYYNQITWLKNTDQTVTQRWDILDKHGILIRNVFLGLYHKKK